MTDLFLDDAISIRDMPNVGRTAVATRDIAAGTLLLRETPILVSTHTLPAALQRAISADDESPEAETVKTAHAFAHASSYAGIDER